MKKQVKIFDSVLEIEVKDEGGFYSLTLEGYQKINTDMISLMKFNTVSKEDLLKISEACKNLALEDWG